MANQDMSKLLQFRDATRTQAKACIVIEGLSGHGKSGLALAIGKILAGNDWKKVFAVDTENKSLDLFEGLQLHTGDKITPFKKLDLLPSHGYAPTNYLICKENAIRAGAEVIINDSISHMWQMEGGVLQRVSEITRKGGAGVNNYTAWGNPEVVEEKNSIVKVVRDSRIHVISTVRIKEKHEIIKDADGKSSIKSLGEQQIFMPDFKYEPDLVLRVISPGAPNGTAPVAEIIKSRYAIFTVGEEYAFTESLINQLKEYLEEGADPEALMEQQRLELIQTTKEILDSNPSKATMFPILKEQLGFKDVPLVELTLETVRTLLGILIN